MNKNLPKIAPDTVVFTNHARERMNLRKVNEGMILGLMRNPKTRIFPQDDGKLKFVGKSMGAKVHVICKVIPEEHKWLVISTWVRGENDDGTRSNYRQDSYTQTVLSRLFGVFVSILLIIIFLLLLYYGS